MSKFVLQSDYVPTGDQPAAIAQLTKGVEGGLRDQTLLGVTGSGKTFYYGECHSKYPKANAGVEP